MPVLSILVPLYNEYATISKVLDKVRTACLPEGVGRQLIVVDDASTDDSARVVKEYAERWPELDLHLVLHEVNSGKGAAIHSAIAAASGDFIIIQDADLEYDPADYARLLQPILDDHADVVYGSRFVGGHPHRILFFWHSIGNKILTTCSNMFTNLNLTDMEIGYKVFRSNILKPLQLQEKRFGFEPEVTAKIARIPGIRIYEVGISYYGRTYEEGKKINWKDGIRALFAILKYNVFIPKEKTLASDIHSPRDIKPWILPLLFFMAGVILMVTTKGTGDEGDSIMHYLYARHAYQYPEHFFDHWAKPLFVLIAAPFAQLGFGGVKFMNLLLATATIWFTWLLAKKLAVPNAWLAALCTAFAPFMMVQALSGLTEPMFGCWMMLGFLLLVNGNRTAGFIMLSFLPFVRSEGLIIICVLVVYLFIKKWWRYIPHLAAGHIVYSIAGYFIHHDLLWVFNKMTYATLSSAYGDGYWNHFLVHLPHVFGIILCFFLFLGLLWGAIRTVGRYFFGERSSISDEELVLVYFCFGTYLTAHSLFWALGIFNSFGLIRVMMPVIPLAAIMCTRGINLFTRPIDKALRTRFLQWFCVALIVIFPFLGTRYGFQLQRDFGLKADQVAEARMSSYIKTNFPGYKDHVFFFEPCYLSLTLDINYFDSTKHKRLLGAFKQNNFPVGSFLVWDDWFAPTEAKVDSLMVQHDPRFRQVGTFAEKDVWGNKRIVKLFQAVR